MEQQQKKRGVSYFDDFDRGTFPSGMIAVCAVAKGTKLHPVFLPFWRKHCTEQREFTHSSFLQGTA